MFVAARTVAGGAGVADVRESRPLGVEVSEGRNDVEIRILQPGDERKLERHLCRHSDSSMILRANLLAAGVDDRGEVACGTYAAAFERGRLLGVVAHYWNGALVPQAPAELAADLGEAAISASGRKVLGALGPADQVAPLLRRFGRRREKPRLDSLEGLYRVELSRLRCPNTLRAQRLQARSLEPDDRDEVVRWYDAYDVETLGATLGPELTANNRRRFERARSEGRGFLLLRDGQRVATSSFNAQLPDAVQIGGVYTPPEERSKGFARTVVAHSLIEARRRGAERAILFTGEDNPAAIRAYRSLGFERFGDFRLTLWATPGR